MNRDWTLSLSVASIGTFILIACAAPDPKKVKSPTKTITVDECKDDNVGTGSGSGSDDASLMLVQTDPTYVDDIEPLFKANCTAAGCHAAANNIPLVTYAQVVANADASLDQINDNLMPVGNPFNQTNKDLFAAWVTAGTPEGEATPAEDEDEDEDVGTGSGSGEGSGSTSESSNDSGTKASCTDSKQKPTTPVTGTDAELLQTKKVEACHKKGVIFDRNANACGTAKIGISYPCTHTGIVDAFAAVGIDTAPVLKKSLGDPADEDDKGDGYQIDQCAKDIDDTPVVVLVKIQGPPEPPGVKVRLLVIE